jgi:predicted dehydrogenase
MPIRFAVLGCGWWAEKTHLPGLATHPDVEIVGVWARNAARAQRVGSIFGVTGTDDLAALLARADAVAVAVPPDVQPALAMAAASAGCHLLLEKPLALTVPAAEEVAAAVERTGVAQVSFLTRRFVPDLVAELAAIAAGDPCQHVRVRFLSGALLPNSPYTDCAWRIERGALWDLGPHALSVLLPALGPVGEIVSCHEKDRTVTLRLRHVNGARSETMLSLHTPAQDCVESYDFEAAGRTRQLILTPAQRQGSFARAISALRDAIAGSLPRNTIRFDAEIVSILAAADKARSG